MSREWFDRQMLKMPTREDIDRHTDEAYERGIQPEIDAEATSRPLDPMRAWPFPAVLL